jgi:spermidine/putrescine-binding protein
MLVWFQRIAISAYQYNLQKSYVNNFRHIDKINKPLFNVMRVIMKYRFTMRRTYIFFIGALAILSACAKSQADYGIETVEEPPVKINFYDWEGDIPVEVIDAFTEETGIQVKYSTYESGTEAELNMYYRNGDFDVVVVDNDLIPSLQAHNLLSPLNYENIPNFKYISIDFRDLIYDPKNTYSVPFNWGTTGLIFENNDEFSAPSSCADFWEYPESVKIGLREDLLFDNFSFTKKVLGASINECDSQVLYRAKERLLALGPNIVLVASDSATAVDDLESGRIDILVGWSDDVFEARERNMDVTYILPSEGTMLWGDSFVVPLRSHHKEEAEAFINFLLEPKNAALILEYNNYASANDSARELLPEDLKHDPIIFPSDDSMLYSEIYLPVSDECNAEQIRLWKEIISEIE